MKKSDLLKSIANLPDDAIILFGNDKEQFVGSFADKLIYDEYNNKILITNSFCDSVPNKYGEVIYEDEIEEE